jgi:hypothetical protein
MGTIQGPSGKRLRNTSLKLPCLVVGRPLADIADRLAGAGVPSPAAPAVAAVMAAVATGSWCPIRSDTSTPTRRG